MADTDVAFRPLSGIENFEQKEAIVELQREVNNYSERVRRGFDEIKQQGRIDFIEWNISGQLAVATAIDGPSVVDADIVLRRVVVIALERGTAGRAQFDINKFRPGSSVDNFVVNTKGRSIYATVADRPVIIGQTATSTQNFTQNFTTILDGTGQANDFYTLDVISAGAAVKHVNVRLYFDYVTV